MAKTACPDCTDWQMSYGKGGWYKTIFLFGLIPIGKQWVECETCEGSGQIEDSNGEEKEHNREKQT